MAVLTNIVLPLGVAKLMYCRRRGYPTGTAYSANRSNRLRVNVELHSTDIWPRIVGARKWTGYSPEVSSRIWSTTGSREPLAIELGEQGLHVERAGDHGEAAVVVARPLLLWSVNGELDAVAVGVAQVDRLGDAVV